MPHGRQKIRVELGRKFRQSNGFWKVSARNLPKAIALLCRTTSLPAFRRSRHRQHRCPGSMPLLHAAQFTKASSCFMTAWQHLSEVVETTVLKSGHWDTFAIYNDCLHWNKTQNMLLFNASTVRLLCLTSKCLVTCTARFDNPYLIKLRMYRAVRQGCRLTSEFWVTLLSVALKRFSNTVNKAIVTRVKAVPMA